MAAVQPDPETAARARPYWQWSAVIRGGHNTLPLTARWWTASSERPAEVVAAASLAP